MAELYDLIDDFYSKLAINFYRNAVNYQGRDEIQSLSSIEVATLEVVYLLHRPTYKELTEFLKISTPNANYRIKKLIEKGYLTREQDVSDRRKYYLIVTEKFMEYYSVNDAYISNVAKKIKEFFPEQKVEQFHKMLEIVIQKLMEE